VGPADDESLEAKLRAVAEEIVVRTDAEEKALE